MRIRGILAGLLTVGSCFCFFPLTSLPAHAHTLDNCPYVLVTAGGTQSCLRPGAPAHYADITQICSEDPVGEYVVLFQDDTTHTITPIFPGKCSSFNTQSGTIAIN